MGKRSRAIAVASLVLILIVILMVVFRDQGISPNLSNHVRFNRKINKVSKTKVPVDGVENKGISRANEPKVNEPDGAESIRTIGGIRKAASDLLYLSEASRSAMLFQQKRSKAHIYMLSVLPPSTDEVRLLRKRLGELQNEAKSLGRDREEFDAWLTKKIDRDDPFGIEGKKIIMIFVPDNPKASLTGMTYAASDFNAELEWIKSNPSKIQKDNSIYFSPDESGDLERFKALIVK